MSPVVIYGGGVAALATALELLDRGIAVDLVGPCEPTRSAELPEGGIQLSDDTTKLERDLMTCSGLAASVPLRALARSVTSIDEWLGRCGVPFALKDGQRQSRQLQGSSAASAAYVEARTADQIAWALDRRLSEHDGKQDAALRRFEPYHLVELTKDAAGHVSGLVAQNLISMDFEIFEGSAVVLASAGCGRLHGSASQLVSEAAVAVAARAGALLADLDRMQLHAAALSRGRGRVVLSGSLRAEGARFWVPVDNREARRGREVPKDDRDFFLEEAFPDAGNLAADDLAARAVRRICHDQERGIYDRQARRNQPLVYLDLTHLPEGHLAPRVGSEIDAIAKVSGVNPYREPIAVGATWSGSLGGLWVDHQDGDDDLVDPSPRNHATSLPGLYAVGDVACIFHGGCRLGGARLLADLFGGRTTAAAVAAYAEAHTPNDDEQAGEQALDRAVERYRELTDSSGTEPAQAFADGLADALDRLAFGPDDPDGLLEAVRDLREHLDEVSGDPSAQANRGAVTLRGLDDALLLAEVAAHSAAHRRKRGDHDAPLRCRLDGDGQIEVADEAVADEEEV